MESIGNFRSHCYQRHILQFAIRVADLTCTCLPYKCRCAVTGTYGVSHDVSVAQKSTDYFTTTTTTTAQTGDVVGAIANISSQTTFGEVAIEGNCDMSYELNSLGHEFFQPEHIFQLDQPIRGAEMGEAPDPNKSPTTVLDLGSGTIHHSPFKVEPQSNPSNHHLHHHHYHQSPHPHPHPHQHHHHHHQHQPHERRIHDPPPHVWHFESSIKHEENSSSMEDVSDHFVLDGQHLQPPAQRLPSPSPLPLPPPQPQPSSAPLSPRDYGDSMVTAGFSGTLSYFKSDSSCRFEYSQPHKTLAGGSGGLAPLYGGDQTGNGHQVAVAAATTATIPTSNSTNVATAYPPYASDVVSATAAASANHYEHKLQHAPAIFAPSDPFSSLDMSQLDYAAKNLTYPADDGSGRASAIAVPGHDLDGGTVLHDAENVFDQFALNHGQHESHYSQSNFQTYMFVPQH